MEPTLTTEETPKAEVKVETPIPLPEVKTIPMEEHQKLQRELAKREDQLRELRDKATISESVIKKIDALEEKIAETQDLLEQRSETGVELTPPARASRVEALKTSREREQREAQLAGELSKEIENLCKEANLSPNDAKLTVARTLWAQGHMADAVQEVRKITAKPVSPQPLVDIETRVAEEVEKRFTKLLRESGLTHIPSGQGVGVGSSIAAYDAYAKGEITSEEAKKRGARFT